MNSILKNVKAREYRYLKGNAKVKKQILWIVIILLIILNIVMVPLLCLWFIKDQNICPVIIAYAGSIIGGVLTLGGVAWTIRDGSNKYLKNLEIQYCPLLSQNVIKKSENSSQFKREIMLLFDHPFFSDVDSYTVSRLIQIKNVGRGEITEFTCKINRLEVTHPEFIGNQKIDLSHSYILGDNSGEYITNCIPVGESVDFLVEVPKLKKEYLDETSFKILLLNIGLEIKIKGAFNQKEYTYQYIFNIEIPKDIEDKETEIFSTSLNNITEERIERKKRKNKTKD